MAVLWWRVGTWWPVIGAALVLGVAVAVAAVGFLLGGRGRSLPGNPVISATITGTAAWLMFAVSGLMFAPSPALSSLIVQALSSLLILAAPPVAVAVVSLVAWQWQLASPGMRLRWQYAATAGAAAAVYTGLALFVFLLQGAFID